MIDGLAEAYFASLLKRALHSNSIERNKVESHALDGLTIFFGLFLTSLLKRTLSDSNI